MLVQAVAPKLRRLLWIGLALLALQVFLGGWTSSNYAALACGAEFPQCLGSWWPAHDFREAFVLWRGIGVDYEGGVLDGRRAWRSSCASRRRGAGVRAPAVVACACSARPG
jgi:cytochrome c oxidase assembly protein subunit 15